MFQIQNLKQFPTKIELFNELPVIKTKVRAQNYKEKQSFSGFVTVLIYRINNFIRDTSLQFLFIIIYKKFY